ncbi:MAG: hypothetical protein ACRERD_22725, partial [Candidatus Binatia bacterium]
IHSLSLCLLSSRGQVQSRKLTLGRSGAGAAPDPSTFTDSRRAAPVTCTGGLGARRGFVPRL